MFLILEVLIEILDYFSYLLEPLIRNLAFKLNLHRYIDLGIGRQGEQLLGKLSAIGRNEFKVDPSMDGLERELQKFAKRHERKSWKLVERRSNALACVRDVIARKWHWVSYNVVALDPVVRMVNWTDYDLCLIDDWDFPRLVPNLWRKSRYSEDLLQEDELRSTNACKTGQVPTELKVICTNNSNKKLYLELTEQRDGKKPLREAASKLNASRPKPDNKGCQDLSEFGGPNQKSIIVVKWLTIEEYQLFDDRSSIIFYYCQLYPFITVLYQILADLFEAANLLEPHVYEYKKLAVEEKNHWTSSNNTNNIDIDYEFLSKYQSHERLNRYALFLMLAAYIDSYLNGRLDIKHRTNQDRAAEYLDGFLKFYAKMGDMQTESESAFVCIWITRKSYLQLNLSTRAINLKDQKNGESIPNWSTSVGGQIVTGGRLLVMDPILQSDGGSCPFDHPCEYTFDEGNTTKDLSNHTVELIGKLCCRLAGQLEDLSCLSGDSKGILDALFTLSRLFRDESGTQLSLANNEQLAMERNSESSPDGAAVSEVHKRANISHERSTEDGLGRTKSCGSEYVGKDNTTLSCDMNRVGSPDVGSRISNQRQRLSYDDTYRPAYRSRYDRSKQNDLGNHETSKGSDNCRPLAASAGAESLDVEQHSERTRHRWLGQRRVLTNLLYVFMFLLARNLLVEYLDSVRSNLKEQAKEDFLAMKHAILETNYWDGQGEEFDLESDSAGWLDSDRSLNDNFDHKDYGMQPDSSIEDTNSIDSKEGEGQSKESEETAKMLGELMSALLLKSLAPNGAMGSETRDQLLKLMSSSGETQPDGESMSHEESELMLQSLFSMLAAGESPLDDWDDDYDEESQADGQKLAIEEERHQQERSSESYLESNGPPEGNGRYGFGYSKDGPATSGKSSEVKTENKEMSTEANLVEEDEIWDKL